MNLSKTKSFTLLEILVTTVLIAIVAISFFTSFVTSFNYLRRLMELRTATLVLQEQVSEARNLAFSDITTIGTSFTSSAMSTLDSASGSISQALYGGGSEIVKISFRLNWTTFDGKPAEKSLVTLMTDHGINKK
jgi:Tfp pilus assembly protein PilE